MEILTTIKSKADALVFAINKSSENGQTFDKGKVDEIYDYILSKVSLPEVETDARDEYMNVLNGMLERYSGMIEGLTSEVKA